MGLDMYLYKREKDLEIITGSKISAEGAKPIELEELPTDEVMQEIGYWRKANQIHRRQFN